MIRSVINRRRGWFIALGGILAAVACIVLVTTRAQSVVGPEGDGLGFGIPCDFVKSADMDPIKYPGDFPPSPSHLHDFFGSTSINAASTNTSLRRDGGTLCDFVGDRKGQDFSAYWTPSPAKAGIKPLTTKAYYKPIPMTDSVGPYSPYPADLKIISGENVWWTCAGGGQRELNPAPTRAPHRCDVNPYIMADVRFPDCLDRRSGLPGNETHVGVYSNTQTGDCPSGYLKVLQLRLHVIYNTPYPADLQQFTSGDYTTYHADFMNGWGTVEDPATHFRSLIQRCVYDGDGCGQDGE